MHGEASGIRWKPFIYKMREIFQEIDKKYKRIGKGRVKKGRGKSVQTKEE